MAIPRRNQFVPEHTPFYLCSTRCVRRAMLCGKDYETGKNFDHRKKWTEEYLLLLGSAFCIDVVSYAVMSNHYHTLLHVDLDRARKLSMNDILKRWLSIYKGTELARRFVAGEKLSVVEKQELELQVERWRGELTNISKFMGYINERIARRANKEDDVTGRFWESRFHMRAILDEAALLQSMVYVDLNPVRARIADTPEESLYTSLRHRLYGDGGGLMPFLSDSGSSSYGEDSVLPITFADYLELIDWSGRQLRTGKRGVIKNSLAGIFKRLGIRENRWYENIKTRRGIRCKALGSVENIKLYSEAIGQKWICQPAS